MIPSFCYPPYTIPALKALTKSMTRNRFPPFQDFSQTYTSSEATASYAPLRAICMTLGLSYISV